MQTPNTTYKNTEIGSIPVDWEVKELREICFPSKTRINPITTTKNFKCIELEHLSQGSGILLGYAQTRNLLSQKSLFEVGDVLFGKLRPYLRKYFFANFEGVCTTEIWVLKTEKDISNRFLYHLIQSDKVIEAANISTGTKMPRAEWKTVSETIIALPTLTEQTAIANALSDADALINNVEKLITKKRNIKQGAMQKLLQPKEGWEVKRLGDYVKITSGESPSRVRFIPNGIPFFKVEQLNNSEKYQFETPYYIETTNVIPKGSIIFPKRGASILLNKVRILKENSFMDTNLMTLTLSEDLNSEFIYYMLTHIELWRIADTTSIPQINNKHINPIEISLPPISEQIEIAQILSDMDLEIAGLEGKLSKYRAIKTGMMQNLLTGKIRLV